MSVVTVPSNLVVENQTWGQQRNDVSFRSMFGSQSIEGSSPLWVSSISSPTRGESDAGTWQALIMQLKGRVNQLAMHNMGRPVPLGTMRGNMTLSASVPAGASSFSLVVPQAQTGTSLLAGDYLGIGSGITQQVVMVVADVASVFDAMTLSLDFTTQTYQVQPTQTLTVTFEPPLRNAFSSGAAVTWDKPKVLFRRNDNKSSWDYNCNTVSGMSLDLIEDVRP